MPSSLPTESALTKTVDQFGIGPYDSSRDDDIKGMSDDEKRDQGGQSLPGDRGNFEDIEYLIGYPDESINNGNRMSNSMLPGEISAFGDSGFKSIYNTLAGPPSDVTTSNSQLPSDSDNPSARSDYYDSMTTGNVINPTIGDMFADDSAGAYASEESLPTPSENTMYTDNSLGPLGNYWSGGVIEDQSVPPGFPSTKFEEESSFIRENPLEEGYSNIQPFGYNVTSGDKMSRKLFRIATDFELVGDLTKEFINKYGKKNIVRRSVLAFLQEKQLPQYLASDIIRCMKHRHKVTIADVMDTFPIAKEASSGLNPIINTLKELSKISKNRSTASELSDCASSLEVVVDMVNGE